MCLKNAFRCISVSDKYLRGQRVSVLKKKQKKKQHDYFFSRDRIFNEKCSNLSIFCKKKLSEDNRSAILTVRSQAPSSSVRK